MARLNRDTSGYTPFGLLLDRLCKEKKISFRQLAIQSGMSATSHASIIRACRGVSTPKRETVLKWSQALGCDKETTNRLLHLAGHATEEEMVGQEE
jgi:transcriptional regulator with XRE-family HTH domain